MNEGVVRLALYNWLFQTYWQPHVFTIDFDIDFVTGNTINGTFGGNPITPVVFSVNQATTLAALATAIAAVAGIASVTVTGARQITVTGSVNGALIVVVGPTVTGGLAQAIVTVTTTQSPQPVQVIRADQTGTRPPGSPNPLPYPFATYMLSSDLALGHEEVGRPDNNGIAVISGQRQATVSIHYFDDEQGTAMGGLSLAYISMEKPSVQAALRIAGIAINSKGAMQNVSAMLETKYEQHATFDFFIGLSDSTTDDLGIIQKVGVEVDIYDAEGSKILEDGPFDITLP